MKPNTQTHKQQVMQQQQQEHFRKSQQQQQIQPAEGAASKKAAGPQDWARTWDGPPYAAFYWFTHISGYPPKEKLKNPPSRLIWLFSDKNLRLKILTEEFYENTQ